MPDKPFSIPANDNIFSHAASQGHLSEAAADHFRNEVYNFADQRASSSPVTQRDAGSGVENSACQPRGLGIEAAPPANPDSPEAIADHKFQIQMAALNAQRALDVISPSDQDFEAKQINQQLKDAHLSPEDAQLYMKTFNSAKGSGFIAVMKPDGTVEVVRGSQT